MRFGAGVDEAPANRVAERVAQALGVRPRFAIDGVELAERSSVTVSRRIRACGQLAITKRRDHENAIVGNLPRRIDHDRAGELGVESAARQARRRETVHRVQAGGHGPVQISALASSYETHRGGVTGHHHQRVAGRGDLAESTHNERFIKWIPQMHPDRRADADADQGPRDARRLPLLDEREDGERGLVFPENVPGGRRHRQAEHERIALHSASRHAVVIRDGTLRGRVRRSDTRQSVSEYDGEQQRPELTHHD